MRRRDGSSVRRASGFTMLEVLLAMGIFAIGVAAVAAIFPAAIMLQREAVNDERDLQTVENLKAELSGIQLTYESDLTTGAPRPTTDLAKYYYSPTNVYTPTEKRVKPMLPSQVNGGLGLGNTKLTRLVRGLPSIAQYRYDGVWDSTVTYQGPQPTTVWLREPRLGGSLVERNTATNRNGHFYLAGAANANDDPAPILNYPQNSGNWQLIDPFEYYWIPFIQDVNGSPVNPSWRMFVFLLAKKSTDQYQRWGANDEWASDANDGWIDAEGNGLRNFPTSGAIADKDYYITPSVRRVRVTVMAPASPGDPLVRFQMTPATVTDASWYFNFMMGTTLPDGRITGANDLFPIRHPGAGPASRGDDIPDQIRAGDQFLDENGTIHLVNDAGDSIITVAAPIQLAVGAQVDIWYAAPAFPLSAQDRGSNRGPLRKLIVVNPEVTP